MGGNKMDKGEHDSKSDIINIEAYFIAHKVQSQGLHNNSFYNIFSCARIGF